MALASCALLVQGLADPALAQSAGANLEKRWGSWIEFGGRFGGGRSIGEGNIFVPVWQGTHSLGFIDLRGSFDNRSAVEGNFGGGFRTMLDNGWNLGVYGHYDLRRSALGTPSTRRRSAWRRWGHGSTSAPAFWEVGHGAGQTGGSWQT